MTFFWGETAGRMPNTPRVKRLGVRCREASCVNREWDGSTAKAWTTYFEHRAAGPLNGPR